MIVDFYSNRNEQRKKAKVVTTTNICIYINCCNLENYNVNASYVETEELV